ncbi:hypothetical protein N7489_004032 [Penicillium chrysogenum]|uniref:uncharacterized protein n=1 Tax=Penicillium chrysogenum TaxID=5076 RepID=UPI0024DF1117|nr:uncharacterized protein N7489_004032 [Penicillium chrysogenum]KAJ5243936.1 hypothetical protein N7489_004032 [Penicillium chrysogenum]
MSAARAVSLRSQVPSLRASSLRLSRAASYSSVSAQPFTQSAKSHRAILLSPSYPVSQLVSPFAALPLTRSFHAGTSLWQQQKQQEGKQGEDQKSESQGEESKEEKKRSRKRRLRHHPMEISLLGRSSSEFKASKEWEESTKALASSAHQFTENENVRRARAAYEAASTATTSKTSTAFKTTGQVIGKGAAWTWNTPVVKGVRKGVNATGEGLEKATRPVRETEAYKSVKEAIDDGSSSRYGGWVEKEERRKQRQRREELERKAGKYTRVEERVEDPNAGTNITIHKDSAWKDSWKDFKDSNPMMQKLFAIKENYNESENPLISTARSISDRVAGFFAENETAMVIKKFREIDPNFQMEPFLREMRDYMLPEVLDAYVKGDVETLKLWLSDAQFHVYAALAKQYTTAGLKSDGRILDIRGVDISHARILDPGDIPVFVVTCRTQEIHVYRKIKTGELAAGTDDKVQLVTYAIGLTRIPDEVNNPETRGWRLIELQKAARDYI